MKLHFYSVADNQPKVTPASLPPGQPIPKEWRERWLATGARDLGAVFDAGHGEVGKARPARKEPPG